MNPKSSAIDTGAQLRALYQPQGGVGAIFSPKVADYVASRPDYPAALFDALREACPPQPGASVADIGAGTGLLTQGLLAQGYYVTAIDPSGAMRAAADQALSRFAHYRSADGSAEHIPLPNASVDLITAAQAFHWFDVDAARAEFLRVLKPHGQVALVWNDRVLTDPLHTALNALFAHYGGSKREALVVHEDRRNVAAFYGATAPQQWSWPHAHHLDAEALQSLVFSRSYIPDKNSPLGQQACVELREIFERLAVDSVVAVRYTTVAMLGRPQ